MILGMEQLGNEIWFKLNSKGIVITANHRAILTLGLRTLDDMIGKDFCGYIVNPGVQEHFTNMLQLAQAEGNTIHSLLHLA